MMTSHLGSVFLLSCIYVICMSFGLNANACTTCLPGACGGQKMMFDLLKIAMGGCETPCGC